MSTAAVVERSTFGRTSAVAATQTVTGTELARISDGFQSSDVRPHVIEDQGLVLVYSGRFQPFHLGHLELVRRALARTTSLPRRAKRSWRNWATTGGLRVNTSWSAKTS